MNQEFNPRLLWDCAESYLSQTLTDIKGPGGVVFWVCGYISGWLSGGVVRGVVAISEAGGPRLGAHRPWWLSVRQGVGVLEMESGQAQNMVISKKRVNLAVAWRSALATRAVQTTPPPSEERKTTCDMDVRHVL